MATLHLISRSSNSLQSCLRLVQKSSAILLIEDAVTATINHSKASELLKHYLTDHRVYALEPDLKARGIKNERMIGGIETVDYDGFVKLTVNYDGIKSWT